MPIAIFIHLTWTTYRRMPMITPSVASFLARFLPAESQRHGAQMVALGVVSDHVHLLIRPGGTFDLPRLVQGLKGASARLANQDQEISRIGLRWAAGYHAKSVSPGTLPRAVEYVKQQARHHPERAIPRERDPRA